MFSIFFVKQFTKDTLFLENENPPKKLSKSHRWRSISRNHFFRDSVKKTQLIVSEASQNCFVFLMTSLKKQGKAFLVVRERKFPCKITRKSVSEGMRVALCGRN